MKTFFDTSVLISAFLELHEHHEPSLDAFLRATPQQAAVAVPHVAVGEVHPGSCLAEFVDAELVGSRDHGNEIKLLDSLQEPGYAVK